MTATGRASRRGRVAAVAVSGGILAIIWSGVWYAAITTGRLASTPQAETASRVLSVGGLLAAGLGITYLRVNRLSVVDGSATEVHVSLPAQTPGGQPVPAERIRV